MIVTIHHLHRIPREHLVFLDGLRAIGALAVVFHHGYLESQPDGDPFTPLRGWAPFFMWGKYGVPLFIVISGFILALPVAQGRAEPSLRWAVDFMKRRARRILPPYYVALALFVAAGLLLPAVIPVSVRAVASHLVMLQNLDSPTAFSIDGPMWSVATEFQIYLIFAAGLAAAWMRWGAWVVCVCATIPSLAVHFVAPQLDRGHLWLFAAFTMGVVAAEVVSRESGPRVFRVASITAILGLGTGAALYGFDHPMANGYDWLVETVLGVGCAASVVWIVLAQRDGRPSKIVRAVAWPPLVAVGLAAYSIYLIHAPVIDLVVHLAGQFTTDPKLLLLVCLACAVPIGLAVSAAFHVVVERRFMNSHMRDMIKPGSQPQPTADAASPTSPN